MTDPINPPPAPATEDPQGAPDPKSEPKITRRKKRFVDEYLTGVTGAEAVRRTGYRGHPVQAARIAYKWLRDPDVQGYKTWKQFNEAEAFGLRKERIVRRLRLIAEANPQDLFGADGLPIPIKDLPEEVALSVGGFEFEEHFEGEGDKRKITGRVRKVKQICPKSAAEILARMMGWNKDKLEHSGEIKNASGVLVVPAVVSEADWEKIAKKQQAELQDQESKFSLNANAK